MKLDAPEPLLELPTKQLRLLQKLLHRLQPLPEVPRDDAWIIIHKSREVATLREALACGKGAWGLVRGAGASPYRRAMGADVPDPYADFRRCL